jgi:hypothetical protein
MKARKLNKRGIYLYFERDNKNRGKALRKCYGNKWFYYHKDLSNKQWKQIQDLIDFETHVLPELVQITEEEARIKYPTVFNL